MMIYDKLLIVSGGESSELLTCQLQMIGYWPTFGETEHVIRVLFWRVRLEKRLPLLRKAAAAHHCPILTQGQEMTIQDIHVL